LSITGRWDSSSIAAVALSFQLVTPKMASIGPTDEVFMSARIRGTKEPTAVNVRVKAVSFPTELSDTQKHFLRVGMTHGKELEPAGPMAGPSA